MKILLLRFSSIGDIVLTTPVARCLKQQLGAEVHYLTKASFASILTPNPNIDRVYSFQKEITEVVQQLKAERYDWVIDLHHNLRSFRLKWALGRPARSFDKLNVEKWLLVNTGIDRLPDIHIVHRYLDAARHLGIQYDGRGLDYFIPPEQEIDLPEWSALLHKGNYFVFVIGATHATKRLPPEKIAAVCRNLHRPVVLLGGKAEAEAGDYITRNAGDHVVNLCGRLSLHQSASAVRQAAVIATHDTGLMHVAAAFGKKIVSIWGNTIPQFGMYPFYPEGENHNITIENFGLHCRPCSKIGYASCPKKHFHCMNTLDIAQICSALESS